MRRIAQAPLAPILSGAVRVAAGPVARVALAAALLVTAAARAQVGSPDPSFGSGGIVVTNLDLVDLAHDVLARPDGTLLVVGETQGATTASRNALLLEYGSEGALLQSRTYFVQPGCSVPEGLSAIAQEADGHLVVGGYAQFGCSGQHQLDFWLIRLDANGGAVLNFDRPIFYGNYDEIRDLAIQPDGRIVAVGVAAPSVPQDSWNFGVARYDTDGTLDTTGFGTAGEVTIDFAGDSDFAQGVAVDAAGRIVVAGYAVQGGQRDIALARLLPDGSLDGTFGTGGIVTTDVAGFGDQANDVAVLPGGAIVVAGTRVDSDGVTADPVLVRYQPDGSLDPTFGVGGIAIADFGFRPAGALGLVVQSDGKLVVAGTAQTGVGIATRDVAVARLLPEGGPDPSFDGDGARTIGVIAGREDVGTSLAKQAADGYLVVAGYTVEPTGGDPRYDINLVRLVGDDGPLIFADGFERGDTSRWSSATP